MQQLMFNPWFISLLIPSHISLLIPLHFPCISLLFPLHFISPRHAAYDRLQQLREGRHGPQRLMQRHRLSTGPGTRPLATVSLWGH